MGSGYGPIVVAREAADARRAAASSRSSCPGAMTTAFLALRLVLGDFRVPRAAVRRDPGRGRVGPRRRGPADPRGPAHVRGLRPRKVLDLGEWWLLETGLPLPLGVNVARRDLGDDVLGERLAGARARRSSAGSTTAAEALEYALQFGRGIDAAVADRFVVDVRERADAGLRRRGAQGRHRAAAPRRGARRVPGARRDRLRPLDGRAAHGARRRPLRRPHADRALRRRARGRAAGRPRSDRDRGGRRARRRRRPARSTTSTSAARTRRARTTATSRAWPRCSPGCPDSVAGVTRQPALRVGALGGRLRVPRGARRRRRPRSSRAASSR